MTTVREAGLSIMTVATAVFAVPSIAFLLGLSFAARADASLDDASKDAIWDFRVLLDGREIGYHRFNVRDEDGLERVDIEARFEVEFLFITAYSYAHDNLETWRGDCLQAIESTTDDNGDQYDIAGQVESAGFRIDRNDTTEALDTPCLKTFAYWNPRILQADRLLNAQTGEWKPISVESIGTAPFEFAGRSIAAEEFRLQIPDGAIRLWYQEGNGQWLGLETETAGGRTLRYEPRSLPNPPVYSPALSAAGENAG